MHGDTLNVLKQLMKDVKVKHALVLQVAAVAAQKLLFPTEKSTNRFKPIRQAKNYLKVHFEGLKENSALFCFIS
ncbi:MAG: hypothetical protein C4330_13150 [Chitinophagaceae bacterium]